jgi:hypothetical protein
MNGVNGVSDIEGKAAMVAASECGQRASFKEKIRRFANSVHWRMKRRARSDRPTGQRSLHQRLHFGLPRVCVRDILRKIRRHMPFRQTIAAKIFGLAIILLLLTIALAGFLLYEVTRTTAIPFRSKAKQRLRGSLSCCLQRGNDPKNLYDCANVTAQPSEVASLKTGIRQRRVFANVCKFD